MLLFVISNHVALKTTDVKISLNTCSISFLFLMVDRNNKRTTKCIIMLFSAVMTKEELIAQNNDKTQSTVNVTAQDVYLMSMEIVFREL